MARALLRWSVRKLATPARVAPGTIVRIESGFSTRPTTIKIVEGALRKGGAASLGLEAGGRVGREASAARQGHEVGRRSCL